ncbi:MAG: prolyl-tRNA editing protein [Marinilabiliales bacterium]|nr:MAG: prolyl-tRNA editing protein [Marinilabiliales bacterium]
MSKKRGDQLLYSVLEELNIEYKYQEHPEAPTADDAIQYWSELNSTHCKNIFFRNHKGNRHYLVVLKAERMLNIKDLEQRLKQGKLSFASEKRLDKYLGLKPGSVSVFGLVHDKDSHVYIFFDKALENAEYLTFHPNVNNAAIVISRNDMIRFLNYTGNAYEFINMYD